MRAPLLLLPLLALSACKDDDTGAPTTAWDCDEAHDGWERCSDEATVEWCHYMDGSPHFHESSDCAELGYACQEYGEGQAACVDTATTCSEGEAWCEDNSAYFCVEGLLAMEPCSTVQACQEGEGVATCEDTVPYDPEQACDLLADGPFEDKAVVTDFASVFSEDYHADLATTVRVTLPDQQQSYLHFPVAQSSDYVVFVDTAGVVTAILDREGADQGAQQDGANSACSGELVDSWSAALENGSGEIVPFVVQLAAVEAQDITLIVMDKGGE